MKKKLTIAFLFASFLFPEFCFNLFSQKEEKDNIFLPQNTQINNLLYSSFTNLFGNDLYIDIWERLWAKKDENMMCVDFMSDNIDIDYIILYIVNIHDICWLHNGNMIASNDSSLFLLDDIGYKEFAFLPYPNMKITPATDTTLYVFGKSANKNQYDISLYDLFGNVTKLLSLEENIHSVIGNGIVSIAVLEKELILFSPTVEPTVFFSANSKIESIVMTEFGGIFIATREGIIYLKDLEHGYVFCNKAGKRLWYINDKLYVLFQDGTLSVIYPISNFIKENKS